MAESRGLRGSVLEEMINMTNSFYREKGLALIQKVPTPITPINIDKVSRHITLAYFDQKSTIDYMGAVQGIPVCFDAKECAKDSFSIQNIHEHQITFMEDFEKQQGIAFFLIYFTASDEKFYLPYKEARFFYDRAVNGGIKHFKCSELNRDYLIKSKGGALVHYLEQLQIDLESRNC